MSEKVKYLDPEIAGRTALITTTLYPNFDPNSQDAHDVDTVRGRLALETLTLAQDQGITVVLIEDGSSPDFKQALWDLNVPYNIGGRGMGAGRRLGFQIAAGLKNCQYILWTEPEKAPLIKNCLPDFFAPLKNQEVQMIVANRAPESFPTYPPYQLTTEYRANRIMNEMLLQNGLWRISDEAEVDFKKDPSDKTRIKNWDQFVGEYANHWIDFLFAPRLFRNTPEMVGLYLDKYQAASNLGIKEGRRDPRINLDIWPNSIVNPVIGALFMAKESGLQVVDIAVLPYLHPVKQTTSETDNDLMAEKRWEQYLHFIISAGQMIQYCEGNPGAKITRVASR